MENTMPYVLIEMNEYGYPKDASVWHTHEDAVCAARSLIKSRGQEETMLEENKDWIADRFSHIATRGTETPDSYIIIRT